MFEQFKARAEAVGSEVYRFKTKSEALDFILSFLKKEGVAGKEGSYAIWSDRSFNNRMEREPLMDSVPGLRFIVTRKLAADSLVGINEMSYALADTGSLVADQAAIEERLVSTLPAIHVAIVDSGNILAGKIEVFKKLNPGNSKYIAFITGPSRTADIERVLTIGVHGPKRLVIIFVDDMGGSK